MTLYGYARVSTEEQSLQRQLDALQSRGVDQQNIYPEKASGTSERRPVLDYLLTELLNAGDTPDLHRFSDPRVPGHRAHGGCGGRRR
ncbi:recombinase family protein [Brachybacterium vulturis]|uniref:recombinase family protein n=1 Tax=Brachybacterium vulturis TaxID=2017484 RepID=UPI0037368495